MKREYKQLEFEFTWYKFCNLYDKENGTVIGGAVLECETDYKLWYVLQVECDKFELMPYWPIVKDWKYT